MMDSQLFLSSNNFFQHLGNTVLYILWKSWVRCQICQTMGHWVSVSTLSLNLLNQNWHQKIFAVLFLHIYATALNSISFTASEIYDTRETENSTKYTWYIIQKKYPSNLASFLLNCYIKINKENKNYHKTAIKYFNLE